MYFRGNISEVWDMEVIQVFSKKYYDGDGILDLMGFEERNLMLFDVLESETYDDGRSFDYKSGRN